MLYITCILKKPYINYTPQRIRSPALIWHRVIGHCCLDKVSAVTRKHVFGARYELVCTTTGNSLMFEISDFGSRGWYKYYLRSESKRIDQLCSDLICTYAKDRLSCDVARMSHVKRTPVFSSPEPKAHR